MSADIRAFFQSQNRGAAAPKKAEPKKSEEPKSRRTKTRRIVDESEDDEDFAPAPEKAAPVPAKKRKTTDEPPAGVATTTSEYFSSSKKSAPSQTPKKPEAKLQKEVEIRVSPRTKQNQARKEEKPLQTGSTNGATKSSARRGTMSMDLDDDDAYVDDEEDGDDIFKADAKATSRRKGDDYMEVDSDGEEDLPKPKRSAAKGKPKDVSDEDSVVSSVRGKKSAKSTPVGKKRKSPKLEDELSEEDFTPKKPAAKKPRTPTAKAKKAPESEDPNVQEILDSIPTVRPPTPPPPQETAKFDWRSAQAGGGHSGPPPNPVDRELPVGQEGCLTGLSFVFTGVLETIGREEAQELVKRYGGKVTGQPSSKTSYVVLGSDAGPSKLRKIREHGIKTINEEGLFELIRRLPAHGGGGKAAEKARQKKDEEEEKVRQQALEMEREEKQRKLEAEKAAKEAAARGAAAPAAPAPASQLWTTKYAPTQLSQICGNKAQVEKIQNWLRGWPKARKYNFQKRGPDGLGGYRAIIISGPPGIGKTTAAHLAAKLEGYDVLETNASDTRSKKLVESGLGDVFDNTSILGFFAGDGKKVDASKKKLVLIMDEVDGMSAGDRGGVGALAKLCKKTEVPLILICNERRLPKMKPFDFVALDIKFQRPTVDQIRSRIMTICHREGLKVPPSVVDALIEGSGKDIRQVINMISTAKLDQTSMDYDQSKAMSKAWEKHVILKPWDICQKLLGGGMFAPASKATLNDKIELYFNDHEFSFLMIQENYLRCKPLALSGKGYTKREERLKTLELFDKAAESISDGDLVDRMIHGPQQQWALMPTHAVFSTVRPASFVAGQLMGSNFTSWLGMNSKAGKLSRFVREIHSHMRLKSSGDHNEIRQQYMPVLWTEMVQALAVRGRDAVDGVIELMDSYYLTRDDFDAIVELGVGPMAADDGEDKRIDSQTKAAFTRTYNAMAHPVPFMKASQVVGGKKAVKEVPDLEEAIEEEDSAELLDADVEEEEDDESDIKKDKYIKQPKPKKASAKKAAAKSKAADDGFIDDDEKPKKAKGNSKSKSKK